jgi:hypothetical protein
MRSELWVCGFAHCNHPRGPQRFHRDTDRQQLRLLVCGRRLHHACGHGVRGLRDPKRPGAHIASGRGFKSHLLLHMLHMKS